jgi:hypothetical protein
MEEARKVPVLDPSLALEDDSTGGSAAIVGTEAHKNLSFSNEVKNLVIASADCF